MDNAMPAVTSLLGRESQIRLLGELLDRVTDQGGSLVVSGGPGIGKSALLHEALRGARSRAMPQRPTPRRARPNRAPRCSRC